MSEEIRILMAFAIMICAIATASPFHENIGPNGPFQLFHCLRLWHENINATVWENFCFDVFWLVDLG